MEHFQARFGGEELYSDLVDKAAVLTCRWNPLYRRQQAIRVGGACTVLDLNGLVWDSTTAAIAEDCWPGARPTHRVRPRSAQFRNEMARLRAYSTSAPGHHAKAEAPGRRESFGNCVNLPGLPQYRPGGGHTDFTRERPSGGTVIPDGGTSACRQDDTGSGDPGPLWGAAADTGRMDDPAVRR